MALSITPSAPSTKFPTIHKAIDSVPAFGGQGVWKEAPLLATTINPNIGFHYFTDFIADPADDTTNLLTGWATVADAGATGGQTLSDMAGGGLAVFADGDDNDEAYVSSRNEAFRFAANKPLWFEARVQMNANGGTSGKSGFVLGLSDVVAANSLVDAGTLMTSFDGALFHKNEDATVIKFTGSNGSTQDADDLATFTDGTWYRLGFIFDPGNGTTGYITPYVDDVEYPRQAITLSGLDEMHIVFGTKMFATTNEASMIVDWVRVLQVR